MPWSQVPDHSERQQKHSRRHRCQRDQSYINDAMNLLSAAAVFTLSKVLLVVAAHLRRKAGDVVPPARQNLTYDWINALLTHGGKPNVPCNQSPATGESAPEPRSAMPAPRGSETTRPARKAPSRPLSELFPGDCSAQTDAPAPQTSHYYHSRS